MHSLLWSASDRRMGSKAMSTEERWADSVCQSYVDVSADVR